MLGRGHLAVKASTGKVLSFIALMLTDYLLAGPCWTCCWERTLDKSIQISKEIEIQYHDSRHYAHKDFQIELSHLFASWRRVSPRHAVMT